MDFSTKKTFPWYGFFLLIAWSGCLFRFGYSFWNHPLLALWSDPLRHWSAALNALNEQPQTFIDPIGFQLWLGVIAKISAGKSILVAIYAGLLSAITPVIWHGFFREFLRNRIWAALGFMLLAWFPSWIGIFSFFMKETLVLPLLGLALWMTLRSVRKQSGSAHAAMAWSWIAVVITHPVMAPAAGVAAIWVWMFTGRNWKTGVRLVLPGLLVLALLGTRSWLKTGDIAPIGMSAHNPSTFWRRVKTINIEYTKTDGKSIRYRFSLTQPSYPPGHPALRWDPPLEGEWSCTIRSEHQLEDWKREYRAAREEGIDWLEYIRIQLLRQAFGTSWPDRRDNFWAEEMNRALQPLWLPLLAGALASSVWLAIRNTPQGSRLVGALFVVSLVTVTLTPGESSGGRSRKPLEAVALALILAAAQRFIEEKNRRVS